LEFGSRWRIATSFGWVHLRPRYANDASLDDSAAAPPADTERARFLLLYELEHSSTAFQALGELWTLLSGEAFTLFAQPEIVASQARVAEITHMLDAELEAKSVELRFEPFAGTFHEREQLHIELPPLPRITQSASETSFIAVRLVDQKGDPVVGHAFEIELPDGSTHRGFTDSDGFGRVRGFIKDGLAQVTFHKLDELDFKTGNASKRIIIPTGDNGPLEDEEEESDEIESAADGLADAEDASSLLDVDRHFIELILVDADETPMANERVVVIDSAGNEFEAISDDLGKVRIEGLAPGDAKVDLRERGGHDWSVEET
jgi:hypothetical protein